jgi:hypothetical protein
MDDRDDHSADGSEDQQQDDEVVSCKMPDLNMKLSTNASSKRMMLLPLVLALPASELRQRNA